MPLSKHLEIDRDDEYRALGCFGSFHQPTHKIVVFQGVHLKPKRMICMLCDVLDRTNRHGRKRVGDPEFCGRAGGFDFTICTLHPCQAHRRKSHRHRHILADHGCLGRPALHIDRNFLTEV